MNEKEIAKKSIAANNKVKEHVKSISPMEDQMEAYLTEMQEELEVAGVKSEDITDSIINHAEMNYPALSRALSIYAGKIELEDWMEFVRHGRYEKLGFKPHNDDIRFTR